MLTVVIDGESNTVTAEEFRVFLDVAVRIMKDASKASRLDFTVAGLHASAPTIEWEPRPTGDTIDVDEAFAVMVERIDSGVTMLEDDEGVPAWMSASTASALYQASKRFDEGAVHGLSFSAERTARTVTRRTYRTLDRVMHEETDAIGSIAGKLVTATLRKGAHVTVQDEVHDRGVECFMDSVALREASQLIGDRVLVVGRVRRDYLGRPVRIGTATVELAPSPERTSVAEMGGAFAGGPESVTWLKDQRGQ